MTGNQLSLLPWSDPILHPVIKTQDTEHARRSKLAQHVLDTLRKRGLAGVLNTVLNKIQFRYGATIHVLRKAGFKIKTEAVGGGVFKYTLLSEPT